MPIRTHVPSLLVAAVVLTAVSSAQAEPRTLTAGAIDHPIRLDGQIDDWNGIEGITVPLSGSGGADSVQLKAAVRGERIYVLAIWDDSSMDDLHKPYRWEEASHVYKKTDRMEDRFALSMAMSGDFTPNKMDGSEFTADVWHWKANRSNPVGLAHDKMWRVSRTPFDRSRMFQTQDGETIHLSRTSDAGDRLYKPMRHYVKKDEIMPLYDVNDEAQGSIADVKAKGVWRDGRWYLELSRRLDTGHDDDAAIPANGTIEFAVAVFDGVSYNVVDGGTHSVSDMLLLQVQAASS